MTQQDIGAADKVIMGVMASTGRGTRVEPHADPGTPAARTLTACELFTPTPAPTHHPFLRPLQGCCNATSSGALPHLHPLEIATSLLPDSRSPRPASWFPHHHLFNILLHLNHFELILLFIRK